MTNVQIQGYRLSSQQARAWRLQSAPSPRWVRCQLSIKGDVNPETLAVAVRNVAERHWLLHSTFQHLPASGIAVQRVESVAAVAWREMDFCSHPDQEKEDALQQMWDEQARQGVDWENGPVLQATLVHLAEGAYCLLLALPAICADPATLIELVREIGQAYAASGQIQQADLIQYVQYAEWQHELQQTEDGVQARERRSGAQAAAAANRNPVWQHAGATERASGALAIELDVATVSALRECLRELHAPVELSLLASWRVLLWRLNDQEPVDVAVWRQGRDSEDLRQLLGPVGRYVRVPVSLMPHASFMEVAEELLEDLGATDEVLDYMPDDPTTNNSEILFEWQQAVVPTSYGSVQFEISRIQSDAEPYTLKLRCSATTQGGIRAELQYDGLLHEGRVRRMCEQWLQLLCSAMRAPNQPVASLDMLGEDERRVLAANSSGPRFSNPEGLCVHHQLEEQSHISPGNVAVIAGDERMSYEELEHKSNQLANFLRTKDAGPDSVVAIALERSLEMVVAVYGVLKAGAAYLPLDLAYPPERLRYMLQDSAAQLVITNSRVRTELQLEEGQCICLDVESGPIARQPLSNPNVSVDPENLAYVIYTSGSTGFPKGVMVSHRGLINYLAWSCAAYADAKGQGSLVHTPLGFDLTVTSFYLPLLKGQPIELVPERKGSATEDLVAALSAGRPISLLKATPGHVNMLAQMLEPQRANGLIGVMVIGGEELHGETLAWWRNHAPQTRLINEYGPTETVVGCCVHEVAATEALEGPIAIGKPIANVRMYVLDQYLKMCPIGVQGEIFIAGEGLARGYLKKPGLTAERFVPDPHASASGSRMYRTGDLARWLESGEIEYLGRNDSQIKLHGYRIELGEIEAALRSLPGVRDAVVLKKEDLKKEDLKKEDLKKEGPKKEEVFGDFLAAYVVRQQKSLLDAKGLRDLLVAKLPLHMVPQKFVFLDLLPYTANGKVDRQALPEPEPNGSKSGAYVVPRTQMEQLVAGIWTEVLSWERLGVHDNFFELGGHSMAAVRIVVRVNAALNLDITPQMLFECATVSKLAERLELELRQRRGAPTIQSPPLAPVARTERLPLSYAQQRLWFLNQLFPGNVTFNLIQAVRLKGALDVGASERALSEILHRHEVLRTTFPSIRGEPHQQIHSWVPVRLAPIDISKDSEEQTLSALRRAEDTPFDLDRGPLFQVKLYQIAQDEHVLVLALHHIVFDAWSTSVLSRELTALYAAFSQGLPSPLPQLPVQYADFAAWEKRALQGALLDHHVGFWRRQLADVPALALNTDHPRPESRGSRGARFNVELPRDLTLAVAKLGHREGATPFMVLLAAFECLMHSHTGQTRFLLGTDVANRNCRETEQLVGFFINQLPLYADLSGNPSFKDLLARTRAHSLEAFAHQELPFDRLVDALKLSRSSSRAPLFDVKLVLDNTPSAHLKMGDLSIEPLDFMSIAAKLDLTLLLQEQDGVLRGWFEYNRDLFEPETIAGMSRQFCFCLQCVTDEPQITVEEIVRRLQRWKPAHTTNEHEGDNDHAAIENKSA